jgi:hypothetical protein
LSQAQSANALAVLTRLAQRKPAQENAALTG